MLSETQSLLTLLGPPAIVPLALPGLISHEKKEGSSHGIGSVAELLSSAVQNISTSAKEISCYLASAEGCSPPSGPSHRDLMYAKVMVRTYTEREHSKGLVLLIFKWILHYTKIFFVLMLRVSKHVEYCSLGVTRKVNNNLSGKWAHWCIKQADWSWKGAFGFDFAFNDTIRFGLVLKLSALPRAIFKGSYCGNKPIRHKRIFKSEKKCFQWIQWKGSLEKTKHMANHLSHVLPSGTQV